MMRIARRYCSRASQLFAHLSIDSFLFFQFSGLIWLPGELPRLFIPDHRLAKCYVSPNRHCVRAAKRLPPRANRFQHHVIKLRPFRFKRANGFVVYNFGIHVLVIQDNSRYRNPFIRVRIANNISSRPNCSYTLVAVRNRTVWSPERRPNKSCRNRRVNPQSPAGFSHRYGLGLRAGARSPRRTP